jgi:hypothetical protein
MRALVVALLGVLCLSGLWASRAAAAPLTSLDASGSMRPVVVAHSTGLRFGLSPGLLLSLRGEPVTFGFGLDLRYGIETGRVILAPGLRLGALLFNDPRVFTSFLTLRMTIPAGRVGPYLLGGVGGGWIERPAFGYLGGGGFLVHIGTRFGIGAEASFQSLVYSRFKVISVGPQLLFVF